MNQTQFQDWLKAYGAAWEDGDVAAMETLFAADAAYWETPFDAPMTGMDAIRQYWQEGAADAQTDVCFKATPVQHSDNASEWFAHWSAAFKRVPSGVSVALDGMLSAEFNTDGKCTVFREWWHRKETQPAE